MGKKLLVMTSGGDSPGMNAGIRAVVRTALYHNLKVYGCRAGFQGILEKDIFPMDASSVANCIQRGGTILQSARFPAFAEAKVRAEAIKILKKQGIDYLVVLGGDGSFRGATLLEKEGGPKVIGIPCTIDNDIIGTDYTIGFDTACNTALEAIGRIRDTAFSHNRNFLVEVMGRNTGFLAIDVGLAGGAEYILIPEVPITTEQLAERIQKRTRAKLGSVIVVAEANHPYRSVKMADDLHRLLDIEYKVCILGHTQRGGTPTLLDRKYASIMGAKAVEALLAGKSQKMLALQKGEITLTEFPDPAAGYRKFVDDDLLHINEVLCDVKMDR